MFRRLRKPFAAFVLFAGFVAAVLYQRYGGGLRYRDLSTPPVLPESALEVAATSSEPIGNVAVSRDGRLFFTIHPESRPERVKLVEWRAGRAVAYPNDAAQESFTTPLGLAIDSKNRLWMVDHGFHGFASPRLVAFDLSTNREVERFAFPREIAPRGSFLQDLRTTPDGSTVVIADVSFLRKSPALVVYDVARRSARRVLDAHPSVMPEDWVIHTPSKRMVFLGGLVALKPGVDGLTITPDGRSLYYGAMTHDTLFRVPISALLDPTLTPAVLAASVQAVGPKPLNDGLSSDLFGNVLLTDVEHQSVMRWRADTGQLETLIRSPKIRWADGLSHGPALGRANDDRNGGEAGKDGSWLYLADSAIPDQILKSKAHMRTRAPYFIWRFRTDRAGVPGQ